MRELEALIKKTTELGAEMDKLRSESSRAVSQHLRPEVLEVIRLLINWPDEGLANSIVKGSEIAGEIPPTRIFRSAEADNGACIYSVCRGETDGALSNDDWAAKLLSIRPPDMDERIAVWVKSK